VRRRVERVDEFRASPRDSHPLARWRILCLIIPVAESADLFVTPATSAPKSEAHCWQILSPESLELGLTQFEAADDSVGFARRRSSDVEDLSAAAQGDDQHQGQGD
jgi:hypothetical protein